MRKFFISLIFMTTVTEIEIARTALKNVINE